MCRLANTFLTCLVIWSASSSASVASFNTRSYATNSMTANYPATITFTYDANGNMLSDGTRTFKYDGENHLTNVFVTGQWKTDFRYDGLGRKRIRRDYTWTGSAWNRTNETRYVYDGFLVLQQRNSNNIPQVTYTRGSDFSASFDGAGGK